MTTQRFPLSSEQCELILAFEGTPTLSALAHNVGRDISVVSRNLARVAEKLPVVEKKSGRWVLTDMGRRLNNHTRDSLQFQYGLSQKQTLLRIGTNREFAARIVGPRLKELMQVLPKTILNIHSDESGTEAPLLEGLIDIGLDCERPFAPEIAYKLFLDEKIVAVSAPRFFKKNHSVNSSWRTR
jgi:DNA-binding transcriptional LysR family regulator